MPGALCGRADYGLGNQLHGNDLTTSARANGRKLSLSAKTHDKFMGWSLFATLSTWSLVKHEGSCYRREHGKALPYFALWR